MKRWVGVVLLLAAPTVAGPGVHPTIPPPVLPQPIAASVVAREPSWKAPERYTALVKAAAATAGIPAWILARNIAAESSWRADAVNVNPDGSRDLGIAQLGERWMMDFIWFDNAGKAFDPFVPEEAIPVAAHYLARLHDATRDWRLAVAAYNCGLKRARTGCLPAKTINHLSRVFGESIE